MAASSPVAVVNDLSVSDSLSPLVNTSSACTLDSHCCAVCCHVSPPTLTTSASEMNISYHNLCSGVSSVIYW